MDLNKTAHYEPSRLDPRCLQIQLFSISGAFRSVEQEPPCR